MSVKLFVVGRKPSKSHPSSLIDYSLTNGWHETNIFLPSTNDRLPWKNRITLREKI